MIVGSVTAMLASNNQAAKNASAVSSDAVLPSVSIEDKISINTSEFSVTSPLEDYLPQGKHISSKKNFKNLKEYIGYLLMLYQKIDKLKPLQGSSYVRAEDRSEFSKLKTELQDLTHADIIG